MTWQLQLPAQPLLRLRGVRVTVTIDKTDAIFWLTSRVTMTFCASEAELKRGSAERGAQLRGKNPLE